MQFGGIQLRTAFGAENAVGLRRGQDDGGMPISRESGRDDWKSIVP
jgi:hypothetical protein